MESVFRVGDPVWAKMKGYPPWPAKIVLPPPSPPKTATKKNSHYVYFFGSADHSWVSPEFIKPHSEDMLKNMANKKSALFQSAMAALINYVQTVKKEKTSPSIRKIKVENAVPLKIKNKKGQNSNPFQIQKGKLEKNPPRIKEEKEESKVPPRIKEEKEESKVPPINKKRKVEHDKNPQAKVIKAVNNVIEKLEVSPNKPPLRKGDRKRSVNDINVGSSEFSLSKSRKLKEADHCHVSFPHSDGSSDEEFPVTVEGNSKSGEKEKQSTPKLGFIGLGMMGKHIVENLLKSNHQVTVWNRTASKCNYLISIGAKKANSPAELVVDCDIIFCCVSDPDASKAVVFGDQGVVQGLERAKNLGLKPRSYVEMTTIDPETSNLLNEVITRKHASYLEAPFCGSSNDAKNSSLIVLASGDSKLFARCEPYFHSIARYALYLSCEVGVGSKMSLLLSMLCGTLCASLAEVMVLAEKLQIQYSDFLQILNLGPLRCEDIKEKAQMMFQQSFEAVTALKNVQKDIHLSLKMGDRLNQFMPVTAAANEIYKHAKSSYSDYDVSAIYKVLKG